MVVLEGEPQISQISGLTLSGCAHTRKKTPFNLELAGAIAIIVLLVMLVKSTSSGPSVTVRGHRSSLRSRLRTPCLDAPASAVMIF